MNSSRVDDNIFPPEWSVYQAVGGKLSDFGAQAKNFLIFLVITNIITSPLTATLNMLVIIAVKTKSRLKAKKSNILLACLAVTDLAVGVIVQPMLIVVSIIDLISELTRGLCFLQICTQFMTSVLCNSSLIHLTLVSGERYLTIKHVYAYANGLVTEVRLLVALSVARLLSITLHIPLFDYRSAFYVTNNIFIGISVAIVAFCHATVYREVSRQQKTLSTQEVTEEIRQKFLKDKEALKLTSTIIVVLFLCYLPITVVRIVLSRSGFMSIKARFIILIFSVSFALFNSFLNPLIYAIRTRQFRVAFIELSCRTANLVEAQEIERRMFGSPNAVEVINIEEKQEEEHQNEEHQTEEHQNDKMKDSKSQT
ncbi:adenosine receptor A3-like [Stylophora pistillata]|uniref:adenosine receptor A3-like n=1 Tax=Stylophora pistillata TaxID=50429 RepID=UPI000C0423F6|nr:adenosine receptor A3-like [Stylophora pistillata]